MELSDVDGAKNFTISTTERRIWEPAEKGQLSRHCFVLVISSRRRDRVLAQVLPDGNLALPIVQPLSSDVKSWSSDMDEIESYLRKVLGVRMHISRYLWSKSAPCILWGRKYDDLQVILLDPLEEVTCACEKARWILVYNLWQMNWFELNMCMRMDLSSLIAEVMGFDREVFSNTKPLLFITSSLEVNTWVKDILCDKGMDVQSDLEVLNAKRTSVLWSCDVCLEFSDDSCTEQPVESIYVKSSLPMTREGNKTVVINELVKDIAPIVIAVHDSDCLIIQRDAGNIEDEKPDYIELMNTMVKLHVRSMNHLEKLKAAGARVRDCNWLISNIIWVTYHPATNLLLESSLEGMLNVQGLRSEVENIIKACRKLSSYQIPNTIVHGDLRPGNIGSREMGGDVYRFYNWENAEISHPFVDPVSWGKLNDSIEYEKVEEALISYCKYWCTFLNDDDYAVVLELASLLHSALTMYRLLLEYELYGVEKENNFLSTLNAEIRLFSALSAEVAKKYLA
ncbi:unnamed protein product [Agarophyton chilense]